MKDKALEALETIEEIGSSSYADMMEEWQPAIDTIKQALQSNVSEEVINEINEIVNSDDYTFEHMGDVDRFLIEIRDKLSQPQPTLEELKQSIIDRLKVVYDNGNRDYYKHIYYDKDYQLFMIEGVMSLFQVSIDRLINEKQYDLAHDITKFFMEVCK